jgi:hypothetical protein
MDQPRGAFFFGAEVGIVDIQRIVLKKDTHQRQAN